MTSLKDVAELAGVSTSTVSRVINGTMYVTDETKQRVEAAIAAVNYKPNLLAQSLRLKATRNIGLLVPEIAHPSFNLMIKYIEESAAKRGLNLFIFDTQNSPEREAIAIDSFLRQRINGLIFSRVSDESHVAHMVKSTNTAMVIIDRAFNNEEIPNIILDNYKAGVLAAKHLIECGCKRVATITGSFNIGLSRDRHQGFKDTLERHGYEVFPDLVHEGEFSFENGIAGVQHFIRSGISFDGIWGQNDLIAAGAISALLRKGYKVPQDVAVMGMDDVQFAYMYHPSITSIAQPYKEMCEKAIDCIDKITRGTPLNNFHVLFPPHLVRRESTDRKRGRQT